MPQLPLGPLGGERRKAAFAGGEQRGAALLIFLILLVMGGLAYVVNSFSPQAIEARQRLKTAAALAQAREALIGYALQYRDRQKATGTDDAMYGFLPMPDVGTERFNAGQQNPACNTEGCAMSFKNGAFPAAAETVIGRLPWRTLGIGPLRDGHGECLWYAVSAAHKDLGIDPAVAMNWDTLGQLDLVAVSSGALAAANTAAHQRPLAIVFSPGPAIGNARAPGSSVVTACGGNYVVGDYLEATGLAPVFATAGGANGASGDTSAQPKPLSTRGKLLNGDTLLANDTGLPVTSEILFAALRKNKYFRDDINALLELVVGCLRDEYADKISNGVALPAHGKIGAGTCYGNSVVPKGYFSAYAEMLFVAPGAATVANGASCNGALLFASQRNTSQQRATAAEKNSWSNYLENPNLDSLTNAAATFSGPERFERVSTTQAAARDIVRCIPGTPSFVAVASAGLTAAGLSQLASYAPGTRTLALGQTVATTLPTSVASSLYGCAWQAETHAMGSGLRSYFKFRILDAGFTTAPHEGFAFAIVDGDNNGGDACGAASQHLGYSGNNLATPFIVPPKIAFEVDPRASRNLHPTIPNFYFDETVGDRLNNGRNDPATTASTYRGGHVAFVYWGGDAPIDIEPDPATCSPPRTTVSGECVLPQEEDDNVHGQPASARSGYPAPPANPAAPIPPLAVPPDTPAGVYKLDPQRSQVPTNQDIHVRFELTRAGASPTLATARVATTGNLDLAAPGASIDGVLLSANDRVLVKDQSLASENGLYLWQGATSPMTRAADHDSAHALTGSVVEVAQGAQNARALWRQTAIAPAIGSAAVLWARLHAKLATAADIDLASPGATLDGIMLKSGDRVLVKAQASAAENGIYLWNGAASAMTRAGDADTAAKLNGLVVQVQQGNAASSWWRFDGGAWQRLYVRVATQAALALDAPGDSIDGITLAAGDRVLVKAQASAAQNGIYLWNGAASAMTRATDADAAGELAGALTQVLAGSDVGRAFRQTMLAANGGVGSDAIQWTAIDAAPGYKLEAWILPDSLTDANKIAAMQDTTRPMGMLYPGFTPHLRDTPIIPYPFRNARVGFTTGQRRTVMDQTITISNSFTTWTE